MSLTDTFRDMRELLKVANREALAQEVYRRVQASGDYCGFVRTYMYDEDDKVVRNAMWALTKCSNEELSRLQPMLNDLIDRAMSAEQSAVRRLTLNIIERLKMQEEDLRTDFLDFCLEHMCSAHELPGIQSLCMKMAFRMCRFYPELQDEMKRTLQDMEINQYPPAVRCVYQRILKGKL